MRKLLLIASAAMMAIAAPAVGAPPQGKGKGPAMKAAKAPAKARGKQAVRTRVARDRVVVAKARGKRPNYGVNACPSGLVAKNNRCLPPGQARRLFAQGQRVPTGYNFYTPAGSIPEQYYNMVPQSYRSGDYRYVYRDNSIYVVDPQTRIVESIISLIR